MNFTSLRMAAALALAVWVAGCGGQSGGGGGAASPFTSSGALVLSLAPSRSSGVAPLGVFFDASATTSTATSLPFHEIKYTWSFGDAAGGATWAFGARPGQLSKNTAYGPVAGHLFETPGTYTVTLTAFDGTNTASTTTTVTVTNPNAAFTGTNTICVANGTLPVAGANGCPAGAAVQTLATLPAVMALATGGKRILLKRGDAWNVTGTTSITTSNNFFAAYGSGPAPKIQFTSDAYGVTTADASQSNLVFMDLDFDGLAAGTNKRALSVSGTNVTVLRATGTGVSSAILIGGNNLFVVDCNFTSFAGGSGNVGIWSADSTRLAILGSRINDATHIEHNIRTQGARPAVYSFNTIAGPAVTKQGLTVRGLVGAWTEHVVVSDNDISGGPAGAGDLVQFAPENTASNEPLRDIIFERNHVWGDVGIGVISEVSSNATFRNNVFNFNGASGSSSAMSVVFQNQAGVAPPTSHFIYNNSVYYGGTAGFNAVASYSLNGTFPSGTQVKNNLAYAPFATNDGFNNGTRGVLYAGNAPSSNFTLANNSTDSQVKNTSPGYTVTPPGAVADFRLLGGSYAAGAGTAVPVWDDIFAATRSVPGDIGAVLH